MTSEQIFDKCVEIYEILNDNNKETEAKRELFYLLDEIPDKALYPPILNHLIRKFGLYPYMNQDTSILEDRFLIECFKTDIGENEPRVLHREQSRVLKKLLNNENLILSAPTSFGKSFIIDALIAIKKPKNVLIIVPTISLLDEARRRLIGKFASEYNIITTSGTIPKEKNIFILTQERVLEYLNFITKNRIDLFIVDEFYKIIKDIRSYILQNAIKQVRPYSNQLYYLCPNVKYFNEKSQHYKFLEGIEKIQIDFNTVALEICDLSNKKGNKYDKLKDILCQVKQQKTMVYVKSKPESKEVCKNIIKIKDCAVNPGDIQLKNFSNWLREYYRQDWDFAKCLANGIGQHNAAMHRFIQQLQVKLFSENEHMNIMITTTSLTEGVNTATKNIIIWNDTVANDKLSSMQYKNIIGRCGRMFKYFIGNVYLLENNKEVFENKQEIMEIIPQEEFLYRNGLETFDEKTKIEDSLKEILNDESKFNHIISKIKDYSILMNLESILEIVRNSELFAKSIKYLNSDTPDDWGFIKKKEIREVILKILSEKSRNAYFNIINYAKYNYSGTTQTINNINKERKQYKININQYFEIEKTISFDIASFFNDLNQIMRILYPEKGIDISSFVTKLSNAFLPSVVYTLEEFGLPRIISKKLHKCGFIDFEDKELTLEHVLDKFKEHEAGDIINILKKNNLYYDFEDYILNYFYDGLGK